MTKFGEIQNLDIKCVNWLAGDNTYTTHELISEAVNVLACVDELHDIYARCVYHMNNFSNLSLSEQIEEGEDIVEELSGYLGEWLE